MKKVSAEKKREGNARRTAARRKRDKVVLKEVALDSAEGLLGKLHRMSHSQRAALRKIIESV